MILRHFYNFKHNLDQASEVFFWPTIDILIWGLTSIFVKQYAPHASFTLMLISGIFFWTLIWRSQREISTGLLEEVWNKNLINIFVSPITLVEWVVAGFITSIIKTALSFILMFVLALFVYGVNIFFYGVYFFPLVLLFLMTAWSVAFFICGILLRYGTRVQTLAWSLIVVISPFSAVYYPITILPLWAQKIALFIPTSYVFEGMREVIQKGTVDPQKLCISFILNTIYLILSIIYLNASFKKVLEKGLVKVY